MLALVGLLACSQSEPKLSTQGKVESAAEELTVMNYEADSPPPPEAPGPPPASAATQASEEVQPPAARKLIYHAEVKMKVTDVPRANQHMDSLVRAFGAYVEEVSETREADEWQHQMKIRVTPGRFQALLNGLGGLGTVEHKELTTEDVTTQHADVSARLRSKRALEQRYIALLSQARKVSDILEIEESMGKIREDIEATESRLRALNNEVAYSTITLLYYQPLSLPTPDRPVLSFGSRLLEAVYTGWQLLIELLLGLVSIWPLLLGLLAGGVLLRWWWRRRRARRAS
ncbi:DUF4349 domain-containing protein [Hymenobacter endophyticus]|uniref:DUF4349 domain-containing protein n=1 Tax=Hymenobacter endophyticus TaxID=3076335 RepID=A0ABU3TCC0_9BACT|nr:DUF4349 domain-containing protein [Hymenobacter endophyticus]MDU0369006.1 DUF4349 domain-containing protein [Hymenobacter endophyticus]